MPGCEKVSLVDTWRNIKADLARYRLIDKRSYPAIFIISPGAVAGVYYRLGHYLWRYRGPFALVMGLLRPLYICGKRLVELYSGASISPRASIGRGLYINHFGSIIVGEVVIGENCNLSHEVTLGVAGRGEGRGLPTIGDRVHFSPGAKALGKIEIGSDVAVGANSVVVKSLPDRAVAGGVPAKVISYQGSFEFVLYESMDYDVDRLESLARRAAEAEEVWVSPQR